MPEISARNRRIARNSLFMAVRMVVVLCITLYATRVVLRTLGVEDYGVYNVVCGFVAMFAFLNTSMANGIQRFYNYALGQDDIEAARRVYNTALLIQMGIGVAVLVLAETVGLWYILHQMVIPPGRLGAALWIYHASLAGFLLLIMQAPYTAAVVAHERMDFYALMSAADAALRLLAALLLPLLWGDRLILYGLLLTLASASGLTLYAWYAHRHFAEIRVRRGLHPELMRRMLGFSGWTTLDYFTIIAESHGVNLVLNLFFGPVVNAARGVAAQVQAGINSFVANIVVPVRPQVVQSYAQGDTRRTLELTYAMMKLSCCFFFMVALPVCLEAPYILRIWLGDHVPAHTAAFVVIVLATAFTTNLQAAISGLTQATGRVRDFQLWGNAIRLCSIPAAYLLMRGGHAPESALLAVMLADLVAHAACCLVVRRITHFPLSRYTHGVLAPILAAVALAAILPALTHTYMHQGLGRLAVVTLCTMVSTAMCLYAVCLNPQERQVCRQFARAMTRKRRKA